MGVDICWRFQREEKPGKWINLSSNYKGDRSYLHFAWLGFDVDREWASTSGVFIHALRGLPDDIPSEDDDLFGEHSYSWLTSEEILSAIPRRGDPGICRRSKASPRGERQRPFRLWI